MTARIPRLALVALVVLSATGADVVAALAADTTAPSSGSPPASTPSASLSKGGRVQVASSRRRTGRRSPRVHRARRPPVGGVYARCAVVIDPLTGQMLFEKNAEQATPIASLTKLMTAMVFLEQKPDLTREVEITREEIYGGGHTQLRNHEIVPLGDLLHMSLMASDNVATRVLARESGLARGDFIARMNAKAQEMDLKGTRFVELTGLDFNNVSTASDVARLLQAAAANPLIHSITTTASYEFTTGRRDHVIGNTNRLLKSRYQILSGKTGYIHQAGYCFATWLRADGRDLIAVVLGAPTNATRFADVVRLVQRTVTAGLQPTTKS